MRYKFNIYLIFLTFLFFNISNAENSIVYLNMNTILNQTVPGKFINEQLNLIHKSNVEEFKKIEKELRDKEAELIAQKNILSNEEYSEKINLLRNTANKYKTQRKEKIDFLTKKRMDASKKLLDQLNSILSDYSVENNISLILLKKNVILGRTELDITPKIVEIVDKKVKKINLN